MRNVKQTIILAPLAAAALVASAPLSSRSANFNFEAGDSVPSSAREATFGIDGGESAPLSARDATFPTNRGVAAAAAVVPLSPSVPPASPGLLASDKQPCLKARGVAAAPAPETAEQDVQGGGYKPDKGDQYKEDKKEKKKEALQKVAQAAVEVGLKVAKAAKDVYDKKKEAHESKGGGYGYGGGKEGGGKGYGTKMVDVDVAVPMVKHVETDVCKVGA
ncbi:uncharacterized protein PpBr36_10086 [Pyricularia pennisetigena]|uniref:uncharacterized protein n=1 Tax=Pyricularia pennisetigena TaxID=1578925 RepID=UPI00114E0BAB|nr:uncharacterized protein PpBr36_10086 [Pyricularia pennisetigena]TLS22322.1 hypothetical protein PpBr36_10086 [Pyricularia pennisetigena]